MTYHLRPYSYCFTALLLLLVPFIAPAQTSTWSNSAKNTTGQKAASTKHKIKDFKEHLQKWGLDTNYNHEFLIGGKLNSDGWSGSMYFVKRKDHHTSNFWEVSFSEIKHEKQVKQQGTNTLFPELGNTTPYVFGKINNLYTLQVGYGKEKLLLPAVMEGNLSVSFRYSGGFSLAMLKPYYLKLIYTDYSVPSPIAHTEQHKYNTADSAEFLNPNTVLGASSWSKGLGEINYVPGVYFQTAISIVPGKNKSFVQVITLGVHAALYAEALSIMADVKSYYYQVSLFAGLAVGKRWK